MSKDWKNFKSKVKQKMYMKLKRELKRKLTEIQSHVSEELNKQKLQLEQRIKEDVNSELELKLERMNTRINHLEIESDTLKTEKVFYLIFDILSYFRYSFFGVPSESELDLKGRMSFAQTITTKIKVRY